ncbi:hypothetical protein ACJJIU_22085 (plasmid) [Microbulbifer sp. CnH-101-E]|uniref:hypothetical protein n=1 Tax=unclassified Microbulbifer TaxID=2619833 RepID=UPI00403A1E7A
MRNNSETFDLHNQAAQRELRLVIEIGFDLPLYISSHNDIPSLPANAVLGALKKCSATSQRIIPEQGRAEIGAISFEVVDLGAQLSYVLRDELEQGNGIKGRTVRLYQGFAGLDWDDFRLEQTQIAEESIGYAEGVYRVRCRDIQREMRRDIFVPNSTRLAANFPKSSSTLWVFDTSSFEPNPHTAAYGDAPNQSVYYLKVKYQDGFEIVRATGKTGNSFTGCTRGLFGTFARDHTLPEESGDESGVEIEEFVYLEGPGPQLAYALLTGKVLGTNNVLPSNWHLGIDPAFVVQDEFENIGADWYKPGHQRKGKILRFDGLEKTDGKKFIETEINLLLGAFMPVNAAGQLGFRRMAGVLAESGTVATITPDDVSSLGELKYNLAGVKNAFSVQWSWFEQPGFDGKFLRSNNLIDADSISTHGESKPHNLKFRGLHNSRHTYTTLKNTFDALRDRFAGPPLTLRLGLLPSKNDLEVGDIVRVSLPQIRDHSIRGDRPLQWDFRNGKEGWAGIDEGVRIETSATGGVLSASCLANDPYIGRNLPGSEQFSGSDVPYLKIRLRRTSEEPIPSYSNFFWRDASNTYHTVNISSEVEKLNDLPINTWQEIVIDLSDEADWTENVITLLRLDIGHNWVADWSYDVDYIRLLPALGLDEYSLDRAMEVQRVSVDQVSGAVAVDLFGSYQPAGMIADQGDSTSAELPDAWYDSDGTAMTAAGLNIDASGFLTADGTLTGNSNSRAIYYYPGDLTIPAGRTLSVSHNVELRVRGVLQIDGAIRGLPVNGGPGFLGPCRGGDGNMAGKEIPGARNTNSARGKVVPGRNPVMPPLNIENVGGDLQGIPDDLCGSGSAKGGVSFKYDDNDKLFMPVGIGGEGGLGGSGLAVIARGIAFGVSGVIRNVGEDGDPGSSVIKPSYAGGSGGGGAPGGIVLLVDGTQNPIPVLTNSKIIACYGESPDGPGRAGQGGICLGTAAVRLLFVPKSRVPYTDYEDPALDPDLQAALDAAEEAKADAQEALEDLGNISADGVLHTNEKLQLIREYNQLINDQGELDALASNFGTALDAKRAAFTNALTALTDYLQGLIPAWDNRQQNTPISRTLFDNNWTYAYEQKTVLLNAVVEATRTKAFDSTRNIIGYDEASGQFTDDGILIGNMQSVRKAQLRAQQASGSVFFEAFTDTTAADDWVVYAGSAPGYLYEVRPDSDKDVAGGNVLRVGQDDKASNAWLEYKERFPFDPNKLYRIKFRVWVGSGGDADRSLYLGINCFDKDGKRVNASGSETHSGSHYIAASGVKASGAGWKEYTAYFQGRTTGNASYQSTVGHNTIAQPAQLQTTVRQFTPVIIANYDATKKGVTQIDYVRIDTVEPTGNGFYLKINSDFSLGDNANPGEAQLCGFDANGNPNGNLPGWYLWNGKRLSIPAAQLNPNVAGLMYIVVRSTGQWNSDYPAMPVTIERGVYKYHYYDGGGKHVAFSGVEDKIILGELTLSSSEQVASGGVYQNPRPLGGFAAYLSGLNENGGVSEQRSLPHIQSSMSSITSGGAPITAKDNGSSAQITVAFHTVQYGFGTVSYNSGSINGLAFSTKYYVYCDDDGYAGGAVTYKATTSFTVLAANTHRRYVGTITTPADGGGVTVPPDKWCVDYDTLLPDGRYVRDLHPGDLVECIDVVTGERGMFPLRAMGEGEEMCYSLKTPEGAEVWQSESTPMDLPDGSIVRTPHMLGKPVYVLIKGSSQLSTVSELRKLGTRRVLKPDFGDRMFFAGRQAQLTIATHNAKQKP